MGRCSIKEIDRQKEEDREGETTSKSLVWIGNEEVKILQTK